MYAALAAACAWSSRVRSAAALCEARELGLAGRELRGEAGEPGLRRPRSFEDAAVLARPRDRGSRGSSALPPASPTRARSRADRSAGAGTGCEGAPRAGESTQPLPFLATVRRRFVAACSLVTRACSAVSAAASAREASSSLSSANRLRSADCCSVPDRALEATQPLRLGARRGRVRTDRHRHRADECQPCGQRRQTCAAPSRLRPHEARTVSTGPTSAALPSSERLCFVNSPPNGSFLARLRFAAVRERC